MDDFLTEARTAGDRYGGIPILLLGIFLAVEALQLLHFVVGSYALIFDESWYAVTTPGEPDYDPDWKLVVGFGLLMGLTLVPLLGAVLVSFARRRKAFIRLGILWLVALFLVAIVHNNLIALIPALHKDGTLNDSAYDALGAGFAALVWIPYLMFSKRIKRVFVN